MRATARQGWGPPQMRLLAALFAMTLLVAAPAARARIDPSSFTELSLPPASRARSSLSTRSFATRPARPSPWARRSAAGRRIVVLEYLRCQNLCSLVLSGATSAIARARLAPGKDSTLSPSASIRGTHRRRRCERGHVQPPLPRSGRGVDRHPLPDRLAAKQVAAIAGAVGFPYRLRPAERPISRTPAGSS